jgi:hypothetical protein
MNRRIDWQRSVLVFASGLCGTVMEELYFVKIKSLKGG